MASILIHPEYLVPVQKGGCSPNLFSGRVKDVSFNWWCIDSNFGLGLCRYIPVGQRLTPTFLGDCERDSVELGIWSMSQWLVSLWCPLRVAPSTSSNRSLRYTVWQRNGPSIASKCATYGFLSFPNERTRHTCVVAISILIKTTPNRDSWKITPCFP